jgi:hypothetical protein
LGCNGRTLAGAAGAGPGGRKESGISRTTVTAAATSDPSAKHQRPQQDHIADEIERVAAVKPCRPSLTHVADAT